MTRLIDAEALKEEFAKHEDYKGYLQCDYETVIDEAPTVTPEPYCTITWDDEKMKEIVDQAIEEKIRPFLAKWTLCSEKLPDAPGVYLVTTLTRGWDKEGKDIIQGVKPINDQRWGDHSNMYAERADGLWVEVVQRVFHDGIWSGYDETVIAWMEIPEPYVDNSWS